jgi:glutamine synthetase
MMPDRFTPADVIQFAKDNNVEMVDLKFVDVPGTLQHLPIPTSELTLELFEEGTGFDGSRIRGFQTIDESDMLLVPGPKTAAIDPVFEITTLSLICNIRDPMSGNGYSRPPPLDRPEGGNQSSIYRHRGRQLLGP